MARLLNMGFSICDMAVGKMQVWRSAEMNTDKMGDKIVGIHWVWIVLGLFNPTLPHSRILPIPVSYLWMYVAVL